MVYFVHGCEKMGMLLSSCLQCIVHIVQIFLHVFIHSVSLCLCAAVLVSVSTCPLLHVGNDALFRISPYCAHGWSREHGSSSWRLVCERVSPRICCPHCTLCSHPATPQTAHEWQSRSASPRFDFELLRRTKTKWSGEVVAQRMTPRTWALHQRLLELRQRLIPHLLGVQRNPEPVQHQVLPTERSPLVSSTSRILRWKAGNDGCKVITDDSVHPFVPLLLHQLCSVFLSISSPCVAVCAGEEMWLCVYPLSSRKMCHCKSTAAPVPLLGVGENISFLISFTDGKSDTTWENKVD